MHTLLGMAQQRACKDGPELVGFSPAIVIRRELIPDGEAFGLKLDVAKDMAGALICVWRVQHRDQDESLRHF